MKNIKFVFIIMLFFSYAELLIPARHQCWSWYGRCMQLALTFRKS